MTNKELFAKLRPIVLMVTGVPEVILANEDGTVAPKGPYASIFPRQNVRERGQANARRYNAPNNRVTSEVKSQIIATCSVNFFRGDAHMYAELLKECNKHAAISMMLMRAGLGWNGTDAVNDLTGLQAANWEQRAQINIRVMYETKSVFEINNILSASAIIEDEKARVIETINVP